MNPRMLWTVVAAAAPFFMQGACKADTVYLSSGREIDGTILDEDDSAVVVKRSDGTTQSFRRADVDSVVYEKKGSGKKTVVVTGKPRTDAKTDTKIDAKPDALKENTKPDAHKEDTKPDAHKEDTKPDAHKEATKPDAHKEDTKPDANKEDTKTNVEISVNDSQAEADSKPAFTNFPSHAKRMDKDKEGLFKSALEKLASKDEAIRLTGKDEIDGLGLSVLPYVVACLQDDNIQVRSACMRLVGQLNGRTAVKQVLEAFYAAMPSDGAADEQQIPFIRAIRETLPGVSGQSFLSAEPKSPLIQDGLKKYIEWYNTSFASLPPQLGEASIDPADPDYSEKLKTGRALILSKKSWPPPVLTPEEKVQAEAKVEDTKMDNAYKAVLPAAPPAEELQKSLPKGPTVQEILDSQKKEE